MGRLIDADVALKRFIQETEASGENVIHINTIKRLLQDIETAYDVEKVVEEIEEDKFKHPFDEDEKIINSYLDRTIKAVRKGGVE